MPRPMVLDADLEALPRLTRREICHLLRKWIRKANRTIDEQDEAIRRSEQCRDELCSLRSALLQIANGIEAEEESPPRPNIDNQPVIRSDDEDEIVQHVTIPCDDSDEIVQHVRLRETRLRLRHSRQDARAPPTIGGTHARPVHATAPETTEETDNEDDWGPCWKGSTVRM